MTRHTRLNLLLALVTLAFGHEQACADSSYRVEMSVSPTQGCQLLMSNVGSPQLEVLDATRATKSALHTHALQRDTLCDGSQFVSLQHVLDPPTIQLAESELNFPSLGTVDGLAAGAISGQPCPTPLALLATGLAMGFGLVYRRILLLS